MVSEPMFEFNRHDQKETPFSFFRNLRLLSYVIRNLKSGTWNQELFCYVPWSLWSSIRGQKSITRNRAGSLVVWFAVLSHWILDLFTHIPDLPLFPGSEKVVGLGLWNSLWGTLALELGVFFLGLAIYLGATRSANRIGSYSLLALVTFLLVTYLANIFGPPPPSYRTVAWSGMLLWFLVPWGYWIDRNRHLTVIPGSRPTKLKYKGKKL